MRIVMYWLDGKRKEGGRWYPSCPRDRLVNIVYVHIAQTVSRLLLMSLIRLPCRFLSQNNLDSNCKARLKSLISGDYEAELIAAAAAGGMVALDDVEEISAVPNQISAACPFSFPTTSPSSTSRTTSSSSS